MKSDHKERARQWDEIEKAIEKLNDRSVLRRRSRDLDDKVREYEKLDDAAKPARDPGDRVARPVQDDESAL
jgi:hypothetical protein